MNLDELRTHHIMFDPKPYGKIFCFVDFGNVRPWAKDMWPEENKYRISLEIDIKKLADVCKWISPEKMFFYYGHFKQPNENNKNTEEENRKYRSSIYRIDRASKSGFDIITKDIKMVPHYDDSGKFVGHFPKCNFDVEMTMTMMKKIEKYDTVLIFTGDSDFGALLSYLKQKGKKIIIVCTRRCMSTELQRVADKYIPAETLGDYLKFISTYIPQEDANK